MIGDSVKGPVGVTEKAEYGMTIVVTKPSTVMVRTSPAGAEGASGEEGPTVASTVVVG